MNAAAPAPSHGAAFEALPGLLADATAGLAATAGVDGAPSTGASMGPGLGQPNRQSSRTTSTSGAQQPGPSPPPR